MDSPFRVRFGTNYSPLESEVSQIKQILTQPCADIERIDAEIARLQSRRLELSTYVDEHRALIAPMRRLPADIIGEIFRACIPTRHNAVMSPDEAPLLLGRICSAWRNIALSTPSIWASIHIAEPDATSPMYERCFQMVKTWLARSGGVPLSISFARSPFSEFYGPFRFLDIIVSVSRRWKHIVLSDCVDLRLSSADVPILQSIEIVHYRARENPGPNIFFRGPSVQRVLLGTAIDPTALPLPRDRLTTLSLCSPPSRARATAQKLNLSTAAALKILSECVNLRHCSLEIYDGVDESINVPPSVELPLLGSLSISVQLHRLQARFIDLLDRLVLPALFKLTLTGLIYCPYAGVVLPTLLSTATQLEHVQLAMNWFSKDSFVTFLHHVSPSLRSLSMQQTIVEEEATPAFVDDEILNLLSPSPDASSEDSAEPRRILFPKLDTIQFISTARFSDEDLLRFIRARMVNAEERLRRVHVVFNRSLNSDILPRVQPFIDEFGLDVSLEYIVKKRKGWNPREEVSMAVDTSFSYPAPHLFPPPSP